MPMRRRDVLIAAGAVGLAIAAPRAARLFKPPFDFEPIPGLPGFRRLTGGPLSAAGDVFLAGIEILPPDRIERRTPVLEVADKVYPKIVRTTDMILRFNDKYEAVDLMNGNREILTLLDSDLSQLGETLAERIHLEDQVIGAMTGQTH